MSERSENIRRIKTKWQHNKRISSRDVEWLLTLADAADGMLTAEELRRQTQSPIGRLIEDSLGGRGRPL